MADSYYSKILSRFQCEPNREAEETFAQTFSEDDRVRLFFINENEAFTDGQNIVVDPAMNDLYADPNALSGIETYLKWDPFLSLDPWFALQVVTRAQTIHECLHVIYSDIPGALSRDPKLDSRNKKKTMALISNIIEDAYIEAVGCSVYDNLEQYIYFGRVSQMFATPKSAGTASRAFGASAPPSGSACDTVPDPAPQNMPLVRFLNHMALFLLYPFVRQDPPEADIADYVTKTDALFLEGCMAPGPDERYDYCSRIFDIILPLIPEDSETEVDLHSVQVRLSGGKTHDGEADTIGGTEHKGKKQAVTIRLFTDKYNNSRIPSITAEELKKWIEELRKQQDVILEIISNQGGSSTALSGKEIGGARHKAITVNENRPKIDPNLRRAYQNIVNKYRLSINSYNARFGRLLRAQVPGEDENYLFGSGISSRRLGDPNGRWWTRTVIGEGVPDMAVLLLVDGSGSMYGERRSSAVISSVILHEVLQKQEIPHAIIEHRGRFEAPQVDINILFGFHSKPEEKLNLMQIDAHGDNRDGLALYWAERYMDRMVQCNHRLLIVLSDGLPAHDYDDYYPPESVEDTKLAVKKLMREGIRVIAVALDSPGSTECYDDLKEIYPNIVACSDLSRLPGQILLQVSKLIG